MAIDIYQKNFKRGFDVKRFRIWMVLLGGFLGGLAGAGIGLGFDKLGDKFRWYESEDESARTRKRFPFADDSYYYNRF